MGGDNPQQSLPGVNPTPHPQAYLPNFNDAYSQYMPESYRSNEPIFDPSAIINAYQKYIPQFQKSLMSSDNPDGPNQFQTQKSGGGGGGGGKSIMDTLDPIGSIFRGLF